MEEAGLPCDMRHIGRLPMSLMRVIAWGSCADLNRTGSRYVCLVGEDWLHQNHHRVGLGDRTVGAILLAHARFGSVKTLTSPPGALPAQHALSSPPRVVSSTRPPAILNVGGMNDGVQKPANASGGCGFACSRSPFRGGWMRWSGP